jgi:hypothetical protein
MADGESGGSPVVQIQTADLVARPFESQLEGERRKARGRSGPPLEDERRTGERKEL